MSKKHSANRGFIKMFKKAGVKQKEVATITRIRYGRLAKYLCGCGRLDPIEFERLRAYYLLLEEQMEKKKSSLNCKNDI